MSHIFISYSRKDLDFAGEIVQALGKNDLDTWIDWKSIPKGEDWEQEIYRGIEEADAFLFLISPDSVASKMCNKEIAHAVENGKRILPIFITNAEVETVKNVFHSEKHKDEIFRRNLIFCRNGQDDFSKAIKETRKTIYTDYEWLKFHTNLQLKALEWERNEYENGFLLHGKELVNSEKVYIANLGKEPFSTELQNQFINKSRISENLQITERNKTRSRLRNLVIILGGIAALAIWFGSQVGSAQIGEQQANARATIARGREEEQASIAIARQLAAQAQPLFADGNSKQMTAVLLAIQSMRMFPAGVSAQILQNNTLANTIATMAHNGPVYSVAFSPDSKYMVSLGCDQLDTSNLCTQGSVRVWEAATGKEISRMTYDNQASSVAFSPDGKYVVSGGCDQLKPIQICTQGSARVWESATGKEISRMTHDSYISSVAFSPDGKYVVSGSWDGTARVWQATTGREISRMTHDNIVNCASFSPDGKYVVSGSDDKTARVWEVATGKEIARMTHNSDNAADDYVLSVAFSPDGKYVVSGSDDKTARVWEATTGKEISRMTHDWSVNSVAFSPDGKYVVSGSWDGTARVWQATTGREISRMTHDNIVSSVAFSPNSKYVVSGSDDGTARVWEVTTGNEIARMTHGGQSSTSIINRINSMYRVSSVAFSPDSKYVASGSDDGTARVWEATTRNEISRMTHDSQVSSVAFSPDDKYVVSGSYDNTARVWEVDSGKEISRMTHNGPVYTVALSPDGKYVVSGSYDGTARVWEATTGNEISRMTHDSYVTSGDFSPADSIYRVNFVAFSPDGKYVVSGSWDGTARVWESATGEEIARMTHNDIVSSVAFSPNGEYVVSGSDDGIARVWESTTGKEIARINHGSSSLYSVAFSPDGKYVVSGGNDNTARVWESITGKEIARITYDGPVNSVVFSPDGKYVVSGGCDQMNSIEICTQGSARVWAANTGQEITRMTHNGTVNSVAFSPDGKYVISGGCDQLDTNFSCTQGSAIAWEANTGQEIARMIHDFDVVSVNFSPDGKYVVSGSFDNTARVWIYRPGDLITEACSRVTRNLTINEWNQYIGDALPYQAICPNLPIEQSLQSRHK